MREICDRPISLCGWSPSRQVALLGETVELDGMDILSLPEMEMRSIRGGRMAMIFQEPMTSLNPVMTIGSQIGRVSLALHLHIRGRQQHARVVELLEQVGIPDAPRRVEEFPHQLSGGMKQRVMIAMALAGQPELLIADEPTTALDVTIQAQILELLKELQKRTGIEYSADHTMIWVLWLIWQIVSASCMPAKLWSKGRKRDIFQSTKSIPIARHSFNPCHPMKNEIITLSVIPGFVPKLQQKFTHCRFADRCENVFDRCWDAVHWME